MRRSIVVLVLALAALQPLGVWDVLALVHLHVTSPPSTAGHVVSSHSVSGVDQLTSISCPTATLCEAVGSNALNGEGVVVTVTKGSPGDAAPRERDEVPPVGLVSHLHHLRGCRRRWRSRCRRADHGGTPGTPQVVQDVTTLQTISCSSTSECLAGGRSPDSGVVFTGTAVHGVFGTTSVNAVSCPDADCTSVASTSNGKYNDVLVPVTAGIPGNFRVVPPGTSTFSAIACSTASSCVVGRPRRP